MQYFKYGDIVEFDEICNRKKYREGVVLGQWFGSIQVRFEKETIWVVSYQLRFKQGRTRRKKSAHPLTSIFS